MIRSNTSSRLAGQVRRAAAILATASLVGMLTVTPAWSEEKQDTLLELSKDGIHFTTGSVKQLIKNVHGLVPGESREGSVWVRNASRDPSQLSFGVANVDDLGSQLLPEYLQLKANAATQEIDMALPIPGSCASPEKSWELASGEALRVDLQLKLDSAAPNETRRQGAAFDLIFVLQDISTGTPVQPCLANPGVARKDASVALLTMGGHVDEVPPAPGPTSDAMPNSTQDWPAGALPQSNVGAVDGGPWPWYVAITIGLLMATSFRRRSRS